MVTGGLRMSTAQNVEVGVAVDAASGIPAADAKQSSGAEVSKGFTHGLVKRLTILLFGVVFPVIVLFQAYQALGTLRKDIKEDINVVQMFSDFKKLTTESTIADDYALFSVMYVEQSNKQSIISKQLLKVVIMQVGFSVISIGLMFIILGINDGGATLAAEGGGGKFDFKTGSTGLVAFVIGAAMAAGGALLPNRYETVGIPSYVQMSGKVVTGTAASSGADSAHAEAPKQAASDAGDSSIDLVKAYNACKKRPAPEEAMECFMSLFRQKYKGQLS
jgi:hypothetical protein